MANEQINSSVSPAKALDLEPIYYRLRSCFRKPPIRWGRFDAKVLIEQDIPALIVEISRLRAPSSATPEEDQRINEARAILFTDLLRYTSHRDNCRFYGEHRTHCAKWAGFHEHRYLDDTHPCTCGAGHPCTCGLQGARTALLKVLVSSQSVSRATSAPQESGEKKK